MTRRAENKIYRAELPAWDGKWLLLSEGLDKTTLADVKTAHLARVRHAGAEPDGLAVAEPGGRAVSVA